MSDNLFHSIETNEKIRTMTDYILFEDIASEDVDELLVKVEKSFDIKFGKTELVHIETFGGLCDHIVNKIQLDHSNDCTTQQAFYKLRDAISSQFEINEKTITPDFPLINFLPRQKRRTMTKELERDLGFKLNILRPPHWVTIILFILVLISLVGLYFMPPIGFLGLAISIGGLRVAYKIGNELEMQTVGQVVEKMTRENYLKSRRNSKSFNRSEIEKVLTDLFSNDLGIEKSKLKREAKFYDNE
jgi:acyl carrier protein